MTPPAPPTYVLLSARAGATPAPAATRPAPTTANATRRRCLPLAAMRSPLDEAQPQRERDSPPKRPSPSDRVSESGNLLLGRSVGAASTAAVAEGLVGLARQAPQEPGELQGQD